MSFLNWKQFAIHLPKMLLPKDGIKYDRWSVIACDQYTSDGAYWNKVESEVGECPSTLHQMIPEIYLEEDSGQRAKKAISEMQSYIAKDYFKQLDEGAIIVERTFASGVKRHGLMLAVDLEQYEYANGSKSLIRSSEGTIVERIPPRLELRSKAPIEYPHILLLIDDPKKTVIESLSQSDLFESVYDFDLGWNGGHIKGNYVPSMAMGKIHDAFEKLLVECKTRHGEEILMAAGDGNHSLATAKEHWNNAKKGLSREQIENHPARFALVELVNIHGDGIVFEPIYRALYDVPDGGEDEIAALIKKHSGKRSFELANLQAALDEYIKNNPEVRIDYIHGEDIAKEIGSRPNCIAFFPEVIKKDDLFSHIVKDGSLPMKAFSIGCADEKRFYLEGRFIV